uniref:PGG domain-containing protein n=1 Tax=Aegilops tauschii subsp. strangulata TaxID=200361 RepID=A0A453RD78_AEGTS
MEDNENRNNDARAAVDKKRLRKVLMLLATFAVSVTYVAGMSTPGGFWDNTENGHRPGDAILKDSHDKRLTVFLCFNTMAFVASLLIIVVLLDRKPRENEAYGCIAVALISLVGAYTAGSCRETDTTIYVSSLVGAVLIFMHINYTLFSCYLSSANHCLLLFLLEVDLCLSLCNYLRDAAQQARSLVLLLATLAATITYQAGLDPPGGVWPDNKNGHMAGDPILLTVNAGRYKAFYYCNSVAFVASLVAIILVQSKVMLETHVLEAAMVLDLFGLIGAYAAGSSRDLSTSIYAMALAGAVLVYVVIHVVFFTLNHGDPTPEEIKSVDKRRKRLLLFAVLAATITYQAGLTPPGGVRLQDDGSSGHQAGDPVLFYNFPRRYTAFFYCNSVSFMLSIALIILLVNPHLYRPAIRSYALAVCTGAGMFGLMGAYAAGSTQHLKTSIYIFVLGAVVLFVIAVLLLVFLDNRNANVTSQPRPENDDDEERKTKQAKRKYLMLLGILVASVTYQAGLDPPGGAWQHSGSGYDAGNPIMHDNQRHRYLAFFYSNSTSFVASIVVIIILLLEWKDGKRWSLKVMNTTIVLDLLALLVAYAAGSSRGWKTSVYVVALVIAVLAYVAVHIVLAISCCHSPREENSVDP